MLASHFWLWRSLKPTFETSLRWRCWAYYRANCVQPWTCRAHLASRALLPWISLHVRWSPPLLGYHIVVHIWPLQRHSVQLNKQSDYRWELTLSISKCYRSMPPNRSLIVNWKIVPAFHRQECIYFVLAPKFTCELLHIHFHSWLVGVDGRLH